MSELAGRNHRIIPLAEPCLRGNELAYLEECIASNFVSSIGPFVERFEREFAAFVGARHAVACSSGTAAIHVALRVLGVGPGDEVFVPTFTFIASASGVVYQGATPTFVDSELRTWNMDPALVVEEIGRRRHVGEPLPKVIEVVHILGHPADIAPLVEVCQATGITLLEDAAEALGASYVGGPFDGRQVGTIGTMGCFSFNGNKVITSGGGGMIVTDDPELARRAKYLTTQARSPGQAYWHEEVGYNYRLSNVGAAVGVAQLEQLAAFLERKRAISERYDEAFAPAAWIVRPPAEPWAARSGWLYSISLRDQEQAANLLGQLQGSRVGARPVWSALHPMPPFAASPVIGGGRVAEQIAATTLSLPSSVGLDPDDQARVIDLVLAAVPA